jgi:hypothetical protein
LFDALPDSFLDVLPDTLSTSAVDVSNEPVIAPANLLVPLLHLTTRLMIPFDVLSYTLTASVVVSNEPVIAPANLLVPLRHMTTHLMIPYEALHDSFLDVLSDTLSTSAVGISNEPFTAPENQLVPSLHMTTRLMIPFDVLSDTLTAAAVDASNQPVSFTRQHTCTTASPDNPLEDTVHPGMYFRCSMPCPTPCSISCRIR